MPAEAVPEVKPATLGAVPSGVCFSIVVVLNAAAIAWWP